jgi:TetR/AcrR family transcriptional regulator, transcriptional repressor of aconitase
VPRVTEQYIQRRRRAILDAACRCFARDGFHATSMDDVIQAAGASPSVVYRWFRGKDELVVAAVTETLQGMVDILDEALREEPPPSLAEAIERILDATLTWLNRDGQDLTALAVHAWTEAMRNPEIHQLVAGLYTQLRNGLAELVRRHQDIGAIRAEIDATEAARPLFALIPGFFVQRLLLGAEEPDSYAAAISTILRLANLDR